MKVSQVAFCTTTVLAAATVATVFATTAVTGTVAMAALSTLAVTLAAVSLAAIAAWAEMGGASRDCDQFFEKTWHHSGHTIPGAYQFVAQILVQRLIFQGIGSGFGRLIANRFNAIS